MSTVFKETWALEIFPNVEPPAMSERLVKVCTGTCTFLHNALKTAADTASVVYFWFALYLITIPSLIAGRLVGSATSAWFGCTAWALSAEIIKLEATAIRYCSLVRPKLSLIRSKTSFKKVESAPCLVPLPTSSLSKIAATEILELFSPSITAFTEEKAHWRSSSLPQERKVSSAPQIVPGWRLYKNRSCPKISSSFTPAASAIRDMKVPFASRLPNTGSISFCAL